MNTDITRIVSGDSCGKIQERNLKTGKFVCSSFTGHTFGVNEVRFSERDNCIVYCTDDKTVRVWTIDESSFKVAEQQIEDDMM